MAKLPHINKMRFGIIDQNYMNALSSSASDFGEMEQSLQRLIGKSKQRGEDSFLATVTADPNELKNAMTGDGRSVDIAWKYSWERVEFRHLPNQVSSSLMLSSASYEVEGVNQHTTEQLQIALGTTEPNITQAYAYNLAEMSNIVTAPIIFGVDISSQNYPAGFMPQKVPNGSVVWITRMIDFSGKYHFFFERQGVHDGSCEV